MTQSKADAERLMEEQHYPAEYEDTNENFCEYCGASFKDDLGCQICKGSAADEDEAIMRRDFENRMYEQCDEEDRRRNSQ